MPIKFNSLLTSAGIDPASVRLLRHQDKRADRDRTPFLLWRNTEDFITYQSRQSPRNSSELERASYWAAFVVTPSDETLFAGLYSVGKPSPGEIGTPNVSIAGAVEDQPYMVFPLQKSDLLSEYEGKLVIDWGKGFLKWVQRADVQDKDVLEVRTKFKEEDWPGYLRLITALSEIASLPSNWTVRLKEAKGVYLLTCPRTGEHYVGSATGTEGFHGRWLEHLSVGGDAVGFRSRTASDYQVSILEVAGSGASDRDILNAERLWIRKLQSTAMGINRVSKFATPDPLNQRP
jgi:hypothetical protein